MGFEILSIGNVAKEPAVTETVELLKLGQRTRLSGKSGLYVVVAVDAEGQTADLIASAGISPVLKRVPFARLAPLLSKAPEEATERVLPFPS